MEATLGTFLTSVVVAAIVSGFVSILMSERRIAAENVIQERKFWREKIRCLSSNVHDALVCSDEDRDARLKKLRAIFALRLNPHDVNDQTLLALILSENNKDRVDEFSARVTLLLKHDWERAKRDASLWRKFWEKPPARVRFEEWRPGCEHDYRVWRFW